MKYLTSFFVFALLLVIPAGNAHAALPFALGTGCAASSAVQGAVSQAAQGALSKVSSISGIGGGLPFGGAIPVKDQNVITNTNTLVAKECVGDPLAFSLKEVLIATLTRSIIDWANNGFEGAPVFVTDISTYLQNAADNVARDFIYGGDLGGICTPYQQNVRTVLARQYALNLPTSAAFRNRVSCSFDPGTGNLDAFLGGDFSQGGWQAWWQIHSIPADNPFGVLAEAQKELDRRQAEEKDTIKTEVDQGNGFLPNAKCDFGDKITNNPIFTNINDPAAAGGGYTPDTHTRSGCLSAGGSWGIVTPGSIINDQVSQYVGSGLRQLESADEVNEIINILIAQLGQKALTSLGGLRGLSSNSSSSSISGQSYVQALASDTTGESITSAQSVLLTNVESLIDTETTYLNAVTLLKDTLNGISTTAYACYVNVAESTASTQKASAIVTYTQQIDFVNGSLKTLEGIRDQAGAATTVNQLNAAADAYDSFVGSGVLHSSSDINALQAEYDALVTATSLGGACSTETQ